MLEQRSNDCAVRYAAKGIFALCLVEVQPETVDRPAEVVVAAACWCTRRTVALVTDFGPHQSRRKPTNLHAFF